MLIYMCMTGLERHKSIICRLFIFTFSVNVGNSTLSYGNDWSSTMCQWNTLNLLYAIAS